MVKVPGCPGLQRPSGYLSTALFLAALCGSAAVLRRKDCQFPDPSDHTTYRCVSQACRLSLGSGVFKAGSMVQHFCEAGYVLAGHPGVSVCKGGQWSVLKPVICKPLAGSPVPRPGSVIAVSSVPVVAAASVTVSALLLVAMVCVLVGPKPCSYWCWRWYEPMEESEVSTVDSCPVPLPSYEEAVYGSQGGPVLPAPPHADAPRPLQGPGPPIGNSRALLESRCHHPAPFLPGEPSSSCGRLRPGPAHGAPCPVPIPWGCKGPVQVAGGTGGPLAGPRHYSRDSSFDAHAACSIL